MSEIHPEVLVGLPDYRPADLGFCYINGLEREWSDANAKDLGSQARQYVGDELAVARTFISLAIRAGVESEESSLITPPLLREDTLSDHCLERRVVTCNRLPFPDDPGRFAVLQQVYYSPGTVAGRQARCMLPIVTIYQRDAVWRSRPALLTERYARPDLQFLDVWIRGTRGTPFFSSGERNHLDFQETLKRCTPQARKGLDYRRAVQLSYARLLRNLVAQPRLGRAGPLPRTVFLPGIPRGDTRALN